MADTKPQATTNTAKPSGISLYDPQKDWLKKEAERQAALLGRPVSASNIVQKLIDAARTQKNGGK